jgi:hypothetical protein
MTIKSKICLAALGLLATTTIIAGGCTVISPPSLLLKLASYCGVTQAQCLSKCDTATLKFRPSAGALGVAKGLSAYASCGKSCYTGYENCMSAGNDDGTVDVLKQIGAPATPTPPSP